MTKEEFESAVSLMLAENERNSNKAKPVIDLFAKELNQNVRVSHITEDKQRSNRRKEQFSHRDEIVIFVCNDSVNTDLLARDVQQNLYKELETVLIMNDKSPFRYYRMLSKKDNSFSKWAHEMLKVSEEKLSSNLPDDLSDDGELLIRQQIYFGAPGTGKSFKINRLSNIFNNQAYQENDLSKELRNLIAHALNQKGKKELSTMIVALKCYNLLKEKNLSEIKQLCGRNDVYYVYVAIQAKPIVDILPDIEDDIGVIKNTYRNNDLKQQTKDNIWTTALGFKYWNYLSFHSIKELTESLDIPYHNADDIHRAAMAMKSFQDEKKESKVPFIERVTFHPNYSYAQFVGTYKPVQDDEDEKQIKYEYVPGPFMRTYRRAVKYPKQKFLLIIEEINRANVAAVFGDVFQLLDRKNGVSEYPIAASEDIKKYLKDNGIDDCEELRIPNNMYIWATMNSADQGVFPMDTAFKRRWEFEYIGIDDNADKVAEYEIPIGKQGDNAKWKVKWDVLRRAINDKLISLGINEDKLLGPFFLSKSILENALVDGMTFVKSFESKVLMYLFEDAARMKVRQLFKISSEKYIYSEVCREFEEKGIGIFDFKQAIEVTDITPSEG